MVLVLVNTETNDYCFSSKRKFNYCILTLQDFDSRHKESEQPHVKEAKSVMLKFGSKSSSNPLTFNVNSLEELVFMTGYEIAVSVGEAENLDPSLTPEQRSVRIRSALVALLQVIAQAGSVGVQRIMSVPYCLDAFCMFMRQHWVHLPTGKYNTYQLDFFFWGGGVWRGNEFFNIFKVTKQPGELSCLLNQYCVQVYVVV